jgi:hypothetical protein
MKLLVIASLLVFTSCSKIQSLVTSVKPTYSIKCYSGGASIYEGSSQGGVDTSGPRVTFTDEDGFDHVIIADCVVKRL